MVEKPGLGKEDKGQRTKEKWIIPGENESSLKSKAKSRNEKRYDKH